MFKGQKVLLRATKREDMARQWEFENDPVLCFLDGGRPRPASMEFLLAYYDNTLAKEPSDEVSFAIEVDGNYIGHCGLHTIDPTAHICELGIEIGDHSYWGQGFGRDAVRLLLTYAFEHMHMNRVWLNTHSENERAIRCYKACGFVEEGRLRQHIWIKGHYVDRIIMGVLRAEIAEPPTIQG
jgi:RimJ/RimL family protein N-acetyltransferase